MPHRTKTKRSCARRAGTLSARGAERQRAAEGLSALDLIEKSLPAAPSPETSAAFAKLRRLLGGGAGPSAIYAGGFAPETTAWPPAKESGRGYFDLLDLIRRVLAAHDLLFLNRQVTYHIAAPADLPRVFADANQVQFAIARMIEHMVRRSARAGCIDIGLKGFLLRSGPGIEISFSCIDRHLTEAGRQAFLDDISRQGTTDAVSGVSLGDCRQTVMRQQGQLWVDFSKLNRPVYHFALPSSEQAAIMQQASQQTFKYDISISNYASVRKRFGIKKSHSLVAQIEHYIRSLVRYPIDMVMAITDKGVISTIYEAQRGASQTVASRISQRLGSEKFRIGRRPVELAFSYHLSPLPSSSAPRPQAGALPAARPKERPTP